MIRVFIFFAFFFGGYFLVIEQKESLSNLFADSSEQKADSNEKTSKAFKNLLASTDNKGSTYLINFWASWCSPCMKELPSLNRLNSLYKEKGLGIITVNTDYEDQDKLIKKTKNDLGLSLEIVKDIKGKYTESFGIEGLPVTILFRDGSLIEKINGEIDFDSKEFRRKIDLLLQSSESSSSSKNM